MLRIWITTMSLGLVLVIGGGPVWAEVIAYPKKGQTQEQFEKDQFDCHKWAKGQTGVDPTQPQQSAAAPIAAPLPASPAMAPAAAPTAAPRAAPLTAPPFWGGGGAAACGACVGSTPVCPLAHL